MTTELKTGMEVIFAPTGKKFTIKTVTDKKVVWYVDFCYKGGNGINILRTASTSRENFEGGIKRGIYIINN